MEDATNPELSEAKLTLCHLLDSLEERGEKHTKTYRQVSEQFKAVREEQRRRTEAILRGLQT